MTYISLPVVSELPRVDGAISTRFFPVHNLMLAITDQCNLRCDYCFVKKTPRSMTLETARKAVDFFLHRNISGAKHQLAITFFGGEPFLEPQLMEDIASYARTAQSHAYKRVKFAATTNGTIVSSRLERLVRDLDMELMISLDGGEAAMSHRPFLSGASSFGVVARNLPRLISWASTAIVRMTFHPGALDLVKNVRLALSLGATALAMAPVIEADWSDAEDRLEAAYDELGEYFLEEARQGRILPLVGTWLLLRQLAHARRFGGRPNRSCSVGESLLGVDPDGNVMPCQRFLYRPQDWLGTVDKPTLAASRDHFLDISSQNLAGCETCSARPVCGGGCRAVSLDAGLGLNGVHPGYCVTTRAHASMVYRIFDTLVTERNPAFLTTLASPDAWGSSLTEMALN